MEFNLLAVVIVSVIGLIAAILLAVASKFMSVPVDEKLEEVRAALPLSLIHIWSLRSPPASPF